MYSFTLLNQKQKILTYAQRTRGSLKKKKKKVHCVKLSNVFLTQVSNYRLTALPEHKTKTPLWSY